jgi:hypothetical protein
MNDFISSYNEYIRITAPINQRIRSILSFYKLICPEEIKDMFVSEYLKEDHTREYESLWFFSDNYVMESDQFLSSDHFDIISINKKITRFAISKNEYDFKNANENSRMLLEFATPHSITGELKASQANCDKLRDIFMTYLKNNLME